MAVVASGGTFAREGEQRVFAYAILASIVLHGALLFSNFLHRDSARKSNVAPGPIVARLAAVRPVAAPAPAEEASKPRADEPPAPPVVNPQPAPMPISKAAPKAPVVAAKPAAPARSPEAARQVTESAAPAAAGPTLSAPPATGPVAKADTQPAPPAATDAADAGTLEQYKLAIYAAAKRYKKYPRVALDNSWEGKAIIHLVIGANGMISSISIKTSSGHEVLDEVALDTLRKAKPMVPIPASLRGKEFGIDVNFIYSLKDENA